MTDGRKDDLGKLRYDLLPPMALAELVKIYTYGAQKYDDNNYRLGLNWSRIYAAMQRHLEAWRLGEEVDQESGLLHLAHAAWGLLTLIEYSRIRQEFDDRAAWWDEIWESIPDFEEYEVSNCGRARKKYAESTIARYGKPPYQSIKPKDNGRGYKQLPLHRDGIRHALPYIHRLVFELFIRLLEDDEQINHRDGNRSNNRVENLEAVTPGGNIMDSYRRGARPRIGPERKK